MSFGSPYCLKSLRELLPAARFVGCDDIEVRAIRTDSRMILTGDVFVAIRGAKSDGHAFVSEAIRRGASAVITNYPVRCEIPQCVVPDTRVAYARICQALEGNPASKLKVIGITGTNGKSTTAILVKSVIEAAGGRAGLIGTIEHNDGVTTEPSALTTPDAEALAKLMRRMLERGCTHVVMEVSSHALDQHRVAGIAFDVAVFTNLTHDHLDYHGDFTRYRNAKARLFYTLRPGSTAVLNADDPTSDLYAADCPARVLRYGIRNGSDLTARQIHLSLDGCRFAMESTGGRCDLDMRLVGEHNVSNCLAAALVGRSFGYDWGVIRAGLEHVSEVPGRLQPVRAGQPFHVFVDYAHTPDAVASVLRSLRRVSQGKIFCLLGAGGDRDRTKRPAMARAAEMADVVVVTSDNPRTEDPHQIISDVVGGFRRIHALAIEPDRREAIRFILSIAGPGDSVLIAGKGHETYQIVGTDRLPFDDRLVAAEWLTTKHGREAAAEKKSAGSTRERLTCVA